jgi:hypothetical protein
MLLEHSLHRSGKVGAARSFEEDLDLERLKRLKVDVHRRLQRAMSQQHTHQVPCVAEFRPEIPRLLLVQITQTLFIDESPDAVPLQRKAMP